jgi:hypothetical protein
VEDERLAGRRARADPEAGYDGFEFDLPEDDGVPLRAHDQLRYFALIRTSGPDHLASFGQQLSARPGLNPSW